MAEPPAPPDHDPDDRDDDGDNPDPQQPPPAMIQPVKEQIGEGADNLRRRQSWFRKRTADSE
jgi:hypothetical protein